MTSVMLHRKVLTEMIQFEFFFSSGFCSILAKLTACEAKDRETRCRVFSVFVIFSTRITAWTLDAVPFHRQSYFCRRISGSIFPKDENTQQINEMQLQTKRPAVTHFPLIEAPVMNMYSPHTHRLLEFKEEPSEQPKMLSNGDDGC